MRLLLLLAALAPAAALAETFAYFGTFADGPYVATFDEETGLLGKPQQAADVKSPGFVAVSPDGRTLYATGRDGKESVVVALRITDDGSLSELNRLEVGGPGVCHVAVSPDGRTVLAVCYSGGQVASFKAKPDGSLASRASLLTHEGGSGVNAKRQGAAHPHSINVSPDSRHAYVCDLGQDRVAIYDLNPKTSKLKPSEPAEVKTPPGGGPRHMSIRTDGRMAIVNLELTSQVVAYEVDPKTGGLTEIEVERTLPKGRMGETNKTAECLFTPDGKAAAVTNRGPDVLTTFYVLPEPDGRTTIGPTSHQDTPKTPRGMGVSPDSRWVVVCGQDDDTVKVYRIDTNGGTLVSGGQHEHAPPTKIPKPVNVRFVRR